jgi:hypothetical protein
MFLNQPTALSLAFGLGGTLQSQLKNQPDHQERLAAKA